MMKITDLPTANSWIRQFDLTDQSTAIALLESLTLVSHNEFNRGILHCLEEICNEVGGKIALYAVREIGDDEKYFKDKRAKPKIANPNNTVGSEGAIAQTIQKFRSGHRGRVLDHPSIGRLRRERVANIVFVDDACLSGNRIDEFIRQFKQSPTLRSWTSSGRLSFYVVAYSISKHAEDLIFARFRSWTRLEREDRLRIRAVRSLPTAHSTCSDSALSAILNLCRRYPKRIPGEEFYRYGYAKTMGTLVFEHGCPNNAPALLWHPKSPNWVPLFPGRAMPASLVGAFDGVVNPVERQERFRRLVGVECNEVKTWGKDHEELLLVLGALRKTALSERDVVHETGLRRTSVMQILSQCLHLGLMDSKRRLTSLGRQELQNLRRLQPLTPLDALELSEQSMYVPTSLRSSRDVV